jgi:hypothetical protein
MPGHAVSGRRAPIFQLALPYLEKGNKLFEDSQSIY